MAQIGEQLALAAGRVLRSGKVVMTAMSSPKKGDGLASGSPRAPQSQGPAIVSDERTSGFPNAPLSPGQADFGVVGQASSSPARLLRRMRTALASMGGGGSPADSVEPSSLTFQGFTQVRPKRPAERPSDVESQADASEQILKELQRVIASQERMRVKWNRKRMRQSKF
jgi:hypothetical protein